MNAIKKRERAILRAAKRVLNNRRLQQYHFESYGATEIKPMANEVVVYLDEPRVFLAVRKEHDHRSTVQTPVMQVAAVG